MTMHPSHVLASAATLVLGTQCVAGVPPDLIAWWPADEHAMDIIGGNHGTLENGAAFAPGHLNDGFDLSGPTDYVRVGEPFSFDDGEDFTVSLWLNQVTSLPDQTFAIDTRKGQFNGWNVSVLNDNRVHIGGRCDNNVHVGGPVSCPIANGQWYHVAATFDWANESVGLYVNGHLEDVRSLEGCDGLTSSDKFFIGAVSSLNPIYNFRGLIDEVQLYNRALTNEEIRGLSECGFACGVQPADLNDDCVVDPADLAQLLEAWGGNPGHPADFNADGVVDSIDLAFLLDRWS